MPERSEKALRLLCWGLGAILLVQVVVRTVTRNPLSGLKIPELPTLSEAAETSPGGDGARTNAGHAAQAHTGLNGTNALAAKGGNGMGTNLVSGTAGSNENKVVSTNRTGARDTHLLTEASAASAESNAVAAEAPAKPDTNLVAEPGAPHHGTNALAQHVSGKGGTNMASERNLLGKGTNGLALHGVHGPMGPGMPGKRAPELPLPVQARVDRVVDSELFGAVFHPMPAGLLGIAGPTAFLRASNGQTGAVKEGDELGGLKLLRIGINRVLVEEDGEKKELMIFQGLGGQSLLPQ